MDRQTLAHYGWIVVVALILAVMLALATPFGKYVMDGVSSIASGYINASNEAMSDANKDKLVAEWEDKWLNSVDNNGSGENAVETLQHIKVAKGAIYKAIDGTVYNEGDDMPTPQYGDIYKYGNYEYCYGINKCEYCCETWAHECCYDIESYEWDYGYISGWYVKCITDTDTPGQILETISSATVSHLADYAFCTTITCDPEHCCGSCIEVDGYDNLTKFIVPSNITDMGYAPFYGCQNLKEIVLSPNCQAVDVSGTPIESLDISKCNKMTTLDISNTNISTIKNIPNSVTYIGAHSCNNITELNLYDTNITYTSISHCDNLSNVIMPKSLTKISNGAFMYCNKLTEIDLSHTQITEIGYNAFQGSGLKCIKLPSTIKFIRDSSFLLTKITDIYYTGTSSQWSSVSIGYYSDILDNNPTIHYNYTPTR